MTANDPGDVEERLTILEAIAHPPIATVPYEEFVALRDRVAALEGSQADA